MSNEAKVSSVKLNFVMNFILTLSGIIFPLITFPYASRILLPVGTGKVAFVTSVVSYFTMIGMLGIPTYGIRACAKVRDDKEKLSIFTKEEIEDAEILVLKNRDGRVGVAKVSFEGKSARFLNRVVSEPTIIEFE